MYVIIYPENREFVADKIGKSLHTPALKVERNAYGQVLGNDTPSRKQLRKYIS
mgnify:CR=1 FL=1